MPLPIFAKESIIDVNGEQLLSENFLKRNLLSKSDQGYSSFLRKKLIIA